MKNNRTDERDSIFHHPYYVCVQYQTTLGVGLALHCVGMWCTHAQHAHGTFNSQCFACKTDNKWATTHTQRWRQTTKSQSVHCSLDRWTNVYGVRSSIFHIFAKVKREKWYEKLILIYDNARLMCDAREQKRKNLWFYSLGRCVVVGHCCRSGSIFGALARSDCVQIELMMMTPRFICFLCVLLQLSVRNATCTSWSRKSQKKNPPKSCLHVAVSCVSGFHRSRWKQMIVDHDTRTARAPIAWNFVFSWLRSLHPIVVCFLFEFGCAHSIRLHVIIFRCLRTIGPKT